MKCNKCGDIVENQENTICKNGYTEDKWYYNTLDTFCDTKGCIKSTLKAEYKEITPG